MWLGLPPTLKQSILMDSHYLAADSRNTSRSRGEYSPSLRFKKMSKNFKDDGQSEFGQETLHDITSVQFRRQACNVILNDSQKNIKYTKGMEGQLGMSQNSFYKRIPLLNQFQAQSNLPEIKIHQILKKQLEYMDCFDKKVLSPKPKSAKEKSSENDTVNYSRDRTNQMIKEGFTRLNSIDAINEEESSNNSNSLNGSKKFQPNGLMNSLRKADLVIQNKFSTSLEIIQQVNKHNFGIAQSQLQNTQMQQSQKHSQKVKYFTHNRSIQEGQAQSQQVTSQPSLRNQRVQTKKQKSTKNNQIQKKLMLIQKSFKMNDEYSMYDASRTEIEKSIESKYESIQLHQNVLVKNYQKEDQQRIIHMQCNDLDPERKLFSNIYERFQKIKQIKNRNFQPKRTSLNSPRDRILPQNIDKFLQRAIQTEQMSCQFLNSQQAQKLQYLQRQNQIIRIQMKMNEQSHRNTQNIKDKLQQENKSLNNQIKRLQRILERSQSEVQKSKKLTKQCRCELNSTEKNKRFSGDRNNEQKTKQKNYLWKINQLQQQLQKANNFINQNIREQKLYQSKVNDVKNTKNTKNNQLIQRIYKYEQNLAKNMQIIKIEQQRILNQWRIIEQFYARNNKPRYSQRIEQISLNERHFAMNYLALDQDNFVRDTGLASIGAKIKSLRNQLANDNRFTNKCINKPKS